MGKMPDEFEGKGAKQGKGGPFVAVAAKAGAKGPEAGKKRAQPLAWQGVKAKGK